MTRIAYVNGRYQSYADAAIHVEDRGFQFADGIYEVCEVRNKHLVDETRHLDRLERSAKELNYKTTPTRSAISQIMREVIRRNRVSNGMVYLQLTRGSARRDFMFPPEGTPSSLIVIARGVRQGGGDKLAQKGIAIRTVEDIRWQRCDIKTVQLLAGSMAKEKAKEIGAKDAWMYDGDGYVTEGASSNAWIVDEQDRLITRLADERILRGITRTVVLELAEREGLTFVERSFTVDEAKAAREAFLTSATALVMPVVKIDDSVVGDGKPGRFALLLREAFHTQAEMAAV